MEILFWEFIQQMFVLSVASKNNNVSFYVTYISSVVNSGKLSIHITNIKWRWTIITKLTFVSLTSTTLTQTAKMNVNNFKNFKSHLSLKHTYIIFNNSINALNSFYFSESYYLYYYAQIKPHFKEELEGSNPSFFKHFIYLRNFLGNLIVITWKF